MASKKIYSPPTLDKIDEIEEWLRELEIWQCVTDIEEKKQGPLVYLSLPDKIRKSCNDIKVSDLNKDDGLKVLIDKIKSLYAKDINALAYMAYDQFENFRRPDDMNIVDYINEFERLNNKIKQFDMNLPTGVLAYKVLNNSNISNEKKQLIRATVTSLTYENMTRQLKAIYDNSGNLADNALDIKSEPVYYAAKLQESTNQTGKSMYPQKDGYRNNSRNYSSRGKSSRPSSQYNKSQYNINSENYDKWGQKTNPVDKSGKVTCCLICKSIYHWANSCPNKVKDMVEDVNITLFTEELHECYITKFVGETFNCAVLDSGCSKNVCGESWLNYYLETLTQSDHSKVKFEDSSNSFRFGDGNSLKSSKRVTFPAKIGEKNIMIKTDVIASDLPLLLSKEAMKKANVKIDFSNDVVKILDQKVNIVFTSSGHYAVPISKTNQIVEGIENKNIGDHVYLTINDLSEKSHNDKVKIANKLHSQFGHATAEKLKKLLKSANISDKELLDIIDVVDKECKVCLKYKKPKLRPVVGFSLSKDFNDVIAADLKTISGNIILHMIDHATRFSAATVMKSKKKEEITEGFIKHWISIFGAPDTILSDNGGEFNNETLQDLGEQFNIVIKATPAESPWSNGIVERHNAVLEKMINKLLLDGNNKYPIDVIVAWAVSAKNALHSCYGYSPNQLVFGRNPNFPSNLINKPPALEEATHSNLVLNHLNAMHEARKAYIEAESNEKLRRALKAKTRVTSGIIYDLGDLVYYKRKDSSKWKGPGTVVGKENKQILIKHGGYLHRVHPCSLQLVNSKEDSNKERMEEGREENNDEQVIDSVDNEDDENDISDDESSSYFYPMNEKNNAELNVDEIDDITSSLNDLSLQASNNLEYTNENLEEIGNPTVTQNILPTVKSKILYYNPDSKSWNEAVVLGRAGKSSGKNKSWLNIKDLSEDKHLSVDFSSIKGWKNSEEEVLIANCCDNIEILEAKERELENWRTHDVYKEVEDNGQKVISTRWVITQKFRDNKLMYKARLVARGFEEENLNDIRKDSPTCCKDNLRLITCIISSNQWKIHSVDVKAAFLQGKGISRDIYLKPPKEAETTKLWKLVTTVYGLCDGPRAWYLRVKDVLLKLNTVKSKFDDSLFYWWKNNRLEGVICCHVDDFYWGGTKDFEKYVIDVLRKTFKTSHEEYENFKYLGVFIQQKNDCIYLDQQKYIDDLEEVHINKDRRMSKGSPLNIIEARQLRGLAGQLNWASSQTRPDMSFGACEVSVSIKDAKVNDLLVANKNIRKLKSEKVYLKFPNLGNIEECNILCYSDAAFANLKNSSSQGGFIIFLINSQNKYLKPINFRAPLIFAQNIFAPLIFAQLTNLSVRTGIIFAHQKKLRLNYTKQHRNIEVILLF